MALRGVKVLELAGLAPAPFCGMLLADMGASVVRVDRAGAGNQYDVTARGKKSISLDLKSTEGQAVMRRLCKKTDVLIEPFRTGVMERLSLGPKDLLVENPGLIYARLTGYGQEGAMSMKAGHDINYLALSGVLSKLGRADSPPTAPINLLADFAGGGMTCAMGILAALVDKGKTGKGQVIDCNMVEGAAYVGSWLWKSKDMFIWGNQRGHNILDTGAHFYDTYETKDRKYMAVGAIEPQFYKDFLQGLGFTAEELPQFGGPPTPELKAMVQERFHQRSRAEWTSIFDELDACVTPVLEMEEASEFGHNKERGAFAKSVKGDMDPIPAPRLSNHAPNSHAVVARPEPGSGEHTHEILSEAGFTSKEIQDLVKKGAVEQMELKAKL